MNAPPSFQFYASDFVGGTMSFTAEQTGAYILLICYQWMNGKLPNDDSALAVLGRCSTTALAVVKTKFVVAPDGFGLINQRLEDVRAAQDQYRAKQAENGRKGGLLSKHRSSTAQATLPAPLERASSSPVSSLQSPISTEEKSARASCEVPSWEEFWSYCQIVGMASEWYAKDKFLAAEQEHWKKAPNWKAYASRCRTWWENDGRPMKPRTASANSVGGRTRQPGEPIGPRPHVDAEWREAEGRWV